MKILILDDMSVRHDSLIRQLEGHDLIHVYDGPAAIKLLDEQLFDIAFLDHDLSEDQSSGRIDGQLTGTDVVKHIVQMPYDKRPRRIVLHSWNMPAARRMAALLSGCISEILFAPFSTVRMENCLL